MPELFSVMFFVVFLLSIGTFAAAFVRGLKEWNTNNHSPRLTVPVVVTAKRTAFRSGRRHSDYRSGATMYYVTFQVESGDRMELNVPGSEFGLLVEGDRGKLTFQGTRFLGFQREY